MVTADNMAKMIASISSGKATFEQWAERNKIEAKDLAEHKEYWDSFVQEAEALAPGQALAPPSEWS